MEIGKKIKEFRIASGVSQEELANAIGVTKSTISKYEIGHRGIAVDTLEKISNALHLDITEFFK